MRSILRHGAMLSAATALVGLEFGCPSVRFVLYGPFRRADCGMMMGAGAKPGEAFVDSRGRRYRRDAKGTVRRVS